MFEDKSDKINDFENVCTNIEIRYNAFRVYRKGNDLTLSMTDAIGREVVQFLHFKEVNSPFGFLHLVVAEKYGFQIPKKKFSLQKNSLLQVVTSGKRIVYCISGHTSGKRIVYCISGHKWQKNSLLHKWSQVAEILNTINNHESESSAYLEKAIGVLDCLVEYHDSSHFQFVQDQLQLMLTPPKRQALFKACYHIGCTIAQFPAAYRMLRMSKAIALPNEKLRQNLLSKTFHDNNLGLIFQELKPQQHLVNILFDEIKLIQAMCLIGGHIIGHASNKREDSGELATSAPLVIEIVCHHGGPNYILRVHPVSTLKAVDILQMLFEDNGGFPVSFICDNCPTNQGVYN